MARSAIEQDKRAILQQPVETAEIRELPRLARIVDRHGRRSGGQTQRWPV